MNKKLILCVLTAFGLAACSSDDGQESASTTKRPLTVVVSENPLTNSANEAKSRDEHSTRGPVITTESLESFEMCAISPVKYYSVTKGDKTWKTTPESWPDVGDNDKISFYAYNVGHDKHNLDCFYPDTSNPYITFTVDELPSSHIDLLVAKRENVSYTETGGVVQLTFDHACAAVNIEVRLTNTLSGNLKGKPLSIGAIMLKNVVKAGTYYYKDGGRWENSSQKGSYTLSSSSIEVTTTPQTLNGGTLFMIPQTLGEDAVFSFQYSLDGINWTAKSISLKGAEWKAGEIYTMDIAIGTKVIKIQTPAES